MKIKTAVLIILILFPLAHGASDENQPLILEHADKLQTSGKDTDNITNLIGNVYLKHGQTQLWSERAIWYKKTDVVIFLGSVRMIDGSRKLNCQNLTYYRTIGSAQAVGEVTLRDSIEAMLLTANKVDYMKGEGQFIATGGPILNVNPDDDSAKTVIVADSIYYDMNTKTGHARRQVVITRKDVKATCEKADFLESGKTIILEGNPQAVQGNNLLSGNQIKLFTEKRNLTGMIIEGNASATYRTRPDTTINQFTEAVLTGKQLELFFKEDKPEKSVMRRNATSVYTPAPTDSTVKGQNTASGDSITLFFDKSRINQVLILGGAQGQYVESKMSANKEMVPETTFYDAQKIDYFVDSATINLDTDANLKFQTMQLHSAQIKYNTNEEILIAQGKKETTDSGEVLLDQPVLKDTDQELQGKRMTYNTRTRRGKVELGRTEFDQGYYRGNKLRKIEDNIMYVNSGEYSSCDKEYQHYHFYCQKMKIINQDKIFARPVVLYIGPVPVMALPYYVFPIRKGRHSGFLTFDIGNYTKGQRYIHNLGYYWAASDYWDGKASLDLEENGKVTINGTANYVVRDKLNGNVSGAYTRSTSWNSKYQRNLSVGWRLNFSHAQTLAPSLKIAASGTFMSNKSYNIDNSYDPAQRLNREISSKASISKSWKSSSLVTALSQNWNLDTDTKQQILPSVSFRRTELPLFSSGDSEKSNKRTLPWEKKTEEVESHWYNTIYYSFSSDYQNKRNFTKIDSVMDWNQFQTLNSRAGLRATPKIFSVITISPSLNVNQSIYKIDKIHEKDTTNTFPTDGYYRRETWSTALSMSTVLYGTVNPGLFRVTGLRHTVTPSVSYNYSPKTDRNILYAKYTGIGSASSKTKSVSMSLANLFQMKYKKGDQEIKYDLFGLNFGANYNYLAKTQRWSDLTSHMTSSALKIVTLDASATHGLYDEVTGKRRYLDPWLKSFDINTSFRRTIHLSGSGETEADTNSQADTAVTTWGDGLNKTKSSSSGKGFVVDLTLNHSYSERRSLGKKTISRWIRAGFDINLTEGWRVNYNIQYDIQAKSASSQSLKITRNLHCWQGEFTWVPSGVLSGYYIRIYVSMHPDIKVEQSRGRVRPGYY